MIIILLISINLILCILLFIVYCVHVLYVRFDMFKINDSQSVSQIPLPHSYPPQTPTSGAGRPLPSRKQRSTRHPQSERHGLALGVSTANNLFGLAWRVIMNNKMHRSGAGGILAIHNDRFRYSVCSTFNADQRLDPPIHPSYL